MTDPQLPEVANPPAVGVASGRPWRRRGVLPCLDRNACLTLNTRRADGIDKLLARVQSRLDAEPAPAVAIEHLPTAVRFTAQTWRPILVTRITDALDAELGPAGREERFSPLG